MFFILGSDPHAVNSTDNVNGIIIIFFVIFIISPMILYNLVYIEIKVGTTCKIMDFGKFKYEMAKKEKESKKKQKVVVIKEVRLRPSIEEHDLSTKAKMAYKFLENGDKVKVSVRFRGRELGHKEIGVEVINKFIDLVKEVGTPDKAPRLEGNTMIVMLDPKKN